MNKINIGNHKMSDTIIDARYLKSGEYLHTTIKKKKKRPNYSAVGNLIMNGIHLISDFTAHESLVFKHIFDARDYETNIAEFSTNILSPTDKVKFSKGYKKLFDKKIIKRIKKGITSTYMINPDLLQPKEYEDAVKKWNTL